MSAPRLLDLFCCAGGAAVGYHRAGFTVYGVDITRQCRYPYAFHLGDALDVMQRLLQGEAIEFTHPDGQVEALTLSDFVAAHASPPCQPYSISANAHTVEYPALLDPVRAALKDWGGIYVIENVVGAPLIDPLTLCGTEFGLQAGDVDGVTLSLRRHRLFESNAWLMGAGGCAHDTNPVGGVYTGSRNRKPEHRDRARLGGYTPAVAVQAALMGIDWMAPKELAASIPPAYTEWIGHQLIEHLAVAA